MAKATQVHDGPVKGDAGGHLFAAIVHGEDEPLLVLQINGGNYLVARFSEPWLPGEDVEAALERLKCSAETRVEW